jgi:GDP-D-mannose 3',5'-epimerase
MFSNKKAVLVCGAGGFIGSHMVKFLKKQGCWVRGVDLKYPEFSKTEADEFVIGDLTKLEVCESVLDGPFEEVYQFAADMGGAGYIFTGEHDADILYNSAIINLHMTRLAVQQKVKKIFYSSSACMYPEHNQLDPNNPICTESSAYPANPDSEYGWEKLFSERLYLAYARNYGLNVRVARFHNIFGPEGTWVGGKEKAPAAICRKIAEVGDGGTIDVWGDGSQTRTFLYIDECIEAVHRLMESDFEGPVNIGSEELVSISTLCQMVMKIAQKTVHLNHIPGPTGVRGRKSDNLLIKEKINWAPSCELHEGLTKTYAWIAEQIELKNQSKEHKKPIYSGMTL